MFALEESPNQHGEERTQQNDQRLYLGSYKTIDTYHHHHLSLILRLTNVELLHDVLK